VLNSAQESNGGPVILSEDAAAIRSALSGEESGAWAESRESGSAPEDVAGSDACSSVARGAAPPDLLPAIEATIEALEAGDIELARARLLAVATALGSHVTSRTDKAFGPT